MKKGIILIALAFILIFLSGFLAKAIGHYAFYYITLATLTGLSFDVLLFLTISIVLMSLYYRFISKQVIKDDQKFRLRWLIVCAISISIMYVISAIFSELPGHWVTEYCIKYGLRG